MTIETLAHVDFATLNSPMLFLLSLAFEGAIVVLNSPHLMLWAFPVFATAGSMSIASMSFLIGRRIGEKRIQKWISPKALETVRRKIRNKGTVALALPALLPPPFPLTPFVLICGALSVSTTRYLVTLGSLRMLRFSIIATLVWLYGWPIVAVLQAGVVKVLIVVLLALFTIGTSVTLYQLGVWLHRYRRSSLRPLV